MQPVYDTLISAPQLAALPAADVRILDCRFDLQDASAGAVRFKAGSITGATYLHLERQLSAPVVVGQTGRHPLPDRDTFRDTLHTLGVHPNTQLVAYDDSGGFFAARFWWLARWLGHRRTAVLDGGYSAWLDFHRADDRSSPVCQESASADSARPGTQSFQPKQVSMQEVRANLESGACVLLDARAADRFHGQNETIDPVAGHIPGALNAPFQGNLNADGTFLDAKALRQRFAAQLGDKIGKPVICYCGSGVSATHNILAMVHAGLPEPALYAGSWSEWITAPDNPIET